MSKTEQQIQQEILASVSKLYPNKVRLFRNNVGKAYGVGQVKKAVGLLMKGQAKAALQTLQRMRPISFGVPGSPDLQGFVLIDKQPVYLGVEVKTPKGKQRKDQIRWMNFIKAFNGHYFVCRSVEEFKMNIDPLLK